MLESSLAHFQGSYSLYAVKEPAAAARPFFDEIPGNLHTRRISLQYVDPAKIVNLSQRPEYSPTISLFQLKQQPLYQQQPEPSPDHVAIYVQRIFVSNQFLSSLEQFLRENAVEVPADTDERPPSRFISYYDLPDLTLIPVRAESIDITKITPAGKFKVIEHISTTEVFRGIDKGGFTLRMIEPSVLETKLREIEADASYTVSITAGSEHDRVLRFHERKDGREHYLFKRE